MDAAAKTKVLRSVFLDPQMDEILRQVAYRRNTSKGDLIRTYVERGLEADRETLIPQRETATKVASTTSRGRPKAQRAATRKSAVSA
jgi:hypothetical protein